MPLEAQLKHVLMKIDIDFPNNFEVFEWLELPLG